MVLPKMFDSATPWDRTRLTKIKKLNPNNGVSIYIRGTPGGFRHASADDVKLIREIGLAIVPNWESFADWFRTHGKRASKQAGQEAAQALHDLGLPTDGSLDVAFSWDYDMDPATFEREAGDLVAAHHGLEGTARATAYGPSAFITYLHNHVFQDRVHWLMASTFGKPYDINQPGVGVVQSHDENGNWIQDTDPVSASDINTMIQPAKLGAWWPEGSEFSEMAPTAKEIADQVEKQIFGHVLTQDDQNRPVTFADNQRGLRNRSLALTKAAIVDAVVAKIPADAASLTPDQFKAIVTAGAEDAVRTVFGDAAN